MTERLPEIAEVLVANPYPGRVLVLARPGNGGLACVYALTGRSESSKRRRIEQTTDQELRVLATDERSHDGLRHYTAALADPRWTVVGNGEQVRKVFRRLGAAVAPALALDDLSYEPDPPIFTPRITVVVDRHDGTAWLGAARRGGLRETADITVVSVRGLEPGDAMLLYTYDSDGSTVRIAPASRNVHTAARDADDLLDEVWSGLNPAFLVAAAMVRPVEGLTSTLRHA